MSTCFARCARYCTCFRGICSIAKVKVSFIIPNYIILHLNQIILNAGSRKQTKELSKNRTPQGHFEGQDTVPLTWHNVQVFDHYVPMRRCQTGYAKHNLSIHEEYTYLRFKVYFYCGSRVLRLVGEFAQEAVGQRGPLKDERRQQKVEPDAAEPVSLEEGHEEPEPDEHHHVDVLKH